ncbi:MAG TPA: TonB-dependent receptor [Gemmatimonadales bacterium]|nr:TonB-dependent receptor [Gemmatimonadales bacterium]
MRRSANSVILGTACAFLLATAATAQVKEIDVPAGDLKTALDSYIRQSGTQLIYRVADVRGVKTHGAHGTLSPEAAMRELLRGTPLLVHQDTTGALVVARKQEARKIPENQAARAPTAALAAPDPSPAAVLQTVVVVGSQIRNSKITNALPVVVLGQRQIEDTGAVTGDDLFRNLPQAGQVTFQSSRTTGNINDARGDVASINLRGLGSGNTLVLIDGRRVVPHPGTQTENQIPVQTYNVNALPLGGLSRVEVLLDGAGAIYGSDAVAGVINNVFDDHFEGLQLKTRFGAAEDSDYKSGTVELRAGHAFSDGTRVSLYGSFTKHGDLLASDMDATRTADLRWRIPASSPFAGDTQFDGRSTSAPWGVFETLTPRTVKQGTTSLTSSSGAFHVEPVSNTAGGCTTGQIYPGVCFKSGLSSTTNDRVLRYNWNPDRTILGNVGRENFFGTIDHDFSENLQFFSELGYYHADFQGLREQSAPLSSEPITIPASNYYNPFGPTTLDGQPNPNRLPGLTNVPDSGLDLLIHLYRPTDTGPRPYTVDDQSYRLLGGLRGEIGGFFWESAVLYSAAHTTDTTHDAISNTLFQQALARSTPDAYNPFNGGNLLDLSGDDSTPATQGADKSFLVDLNRRDSTSLAQWDFKVSRNDLLRLPAGNVGVAAGVEARRETYEDLRDPRQNGTITYTDMVTGVTYGSDVMGASPAPDSRGSREVESAYAEFAVPVISPGMDIPLVESLDMQLAERYEHYSDFGGVAKPKIAGKWQVEDWLALRGSWSESFLAPNLAQLSTSVSDVSNTRTDYAYCLVNGISQSGCASQGVVSQRSGSGSLRPEDAHTLSFGLIFRPTALSGRHGDVLATVDFWRISESNTIGILGDLDQMSLDYLDRLHGTSNPNVVRAAPLPGETIGEISYINDIYTNLNPRTIQGLDYSIDYNLRDTAWGSFDTSLNVAQLLKFYQSPSAPVAQLLAAKASGELPTYIPVDGGGSLLGVEGNVRWRGSLSFDWSKGRWGLGGLVDYIGSYLDTSAYLDNGQDWKVDSWTTVDVHGSYTFGHEGKPWSSRVILGVNNVGDTLPPLVAFSSYGFDAEYASVLGRFYYVSVTTNL